MSQRERFAEVPYDPGMKRILIAAGAATALSLSACGTASPDVATEVAVSPTTAAAAENGTATVEQYAGEVAALKADIAEWQDDWDDQTCSSLAAQEDPLCNAQVLIGQMAAATHAAKLSSMSKETAPGFIGHPHPDIASLYEETLATAEAAETAGDDWSALNCPDDDGCTGAVFQLVSSLDDLASAYEKWSPHL